DHPASCRKKRQHGTPWPRSNGRGSEGNGLPFALRRGAGAPAATAAAGGRPAIVGWAVLEEEGVVAQRMTLGVRRVGLAEDLARPLPVGMNLGDHRLVFGG